MRRLGFVGSCHSESLSVAYHNQTTKYCHSGSTGNANSTDASKTTNTTQSTAKTPAISVKVQPSALAIDAAAAELKTVNKYMSMKEVDYKLSEHSAFTVAKNQLLKLNHDKVTKVCHISRP